MVGVGRPNAERGIFMKKRGKITRKRSDLFLKVTTKKGGNGTYIFFLARGGDYHAFLEVAAKVAARDCGAPDKTQNGRSRNAREMCRELCPELRRPT
jgi:hypothetical protein